MKLHASALCVALLGSSLLVIFGSASGQTPETPNLEGIYTLNNPSPCNAIRKTIEDSFTGDFAYKGRVLNKLRNSNLPPSRRLVIAFTPGAVTISTNLDGTIETPIDGAPVIGIRDTDTFTITTRWANGKLERTFKSKLGERVNAYSLNADGTLTMQVTVSSKYLPQPLRYDLVYTRTTTDRYYVTQGYPDCRKDEQRRQKAGGVRVSKAAESAKREVKRRFNHLERKVVQSSSGKVKGYEPQDVISSIEAGKAEFIRNLKGDDFAAMRSFATTYFIPPTESELIGESPAKLVTESTKDQFEKKYVRLFEQFMTFSHEPFTVSLIVESDPDMADFDMWAARGQHSPTTTNNTLQNVHRGVYSYRLSKTGYKTIESNLTLDLVNGGNRLVCKLNRDTDTDGPHVCKQQP